MTGDTPGNRTGNAAGNNDPGGGRRRGGLSRIVLILLVGVLVGANAVYYLMTRGMFGHTPAVPAPVATEAPSATPPGVDDPGVPPVSPPPPSTRSVPPTPSAWLPAPVRAPSGLIVPVSGITSEQLHDTFTDARGADRVHDAIDIMAPRGTPVLAVADGEVEKIFDSDGGGGLTVYQFEPSGRYAYYYAHLDRYAAGLVEGKALKQGEVIGYVGSTGNASPDAPHLHFAIFLLGPEKQWWKGTPINPYPLLGGR